MKKNIMENKSKVSPLTLDGHWFVHFGAGIDADSPKIEGSKIVEITGTVDCDEFLTLLSNNVLDSLPKDMKDLISKKWLNIDNQVFKQARLTCECKEKSLMQTN